MIEPLALFGTPMLGHGALPEPSSALAAFNLLICVIALIGTQAIAKMMLRARADNKPTERRYLRLMLIGMGLSVLSYISREFNSVHSLDITVMSIMLCFVGTVLLWLGWIGYVRARKSG